MSLETDTFDFGYWGLIVDYPYPRDWYLEGYSFFFLFSCFLPIDLLQLLHLSYFIELLILFLSFLTLSNHIFSLASLIFPWFVPAWMIEAIFFLFFCLLTNHISFSSFLYHF